MIYETTNQNSNKESRNKVTGILKSGLAALVTTAMTLGPGCATVQTNLAENIRGNPTSTTPYNTEGFSIGETRYVINKNPKTVDLPSSNNPYTADTVMKIRETIADQYGNQVEFTPKNPKDIYAIVPVNFSENNKHLYLVDPRNDKKDVIILPPRFNIPETKEKIGFAVRDATTEPININQTLHFPGIGEVYILKSKFSVAINKDSRQALTAAPFVIMPIKESGSRVDYGTGELGLIGTLYAPVQLPEKETKPEVRNPAIKIEKGSTTNQEVYNQITEN